jgi:inner membrane protein involved in colicin E2 resistance
LISGSEEKPGVIMGSSGGSMPVHQQSSQSDRQERQLTLVLLLLLCGMVALVVVPAGSIGR